MSKSNILIAGVGNPYRCDDGVGIEIIKILCKENYPDVDLFDGGTDGFSLFDKLSLYEHVIIVDAVFMGEQPGTIKLFKPQEAKLMIKSDALSTHGFGLSEVLKLAEEFNVKAKIKIIGIQPASVGFGKELSQVIMDKVPQILALLKQEIVASR